MNGSERIILHCDCNAYFASVEELFRPELKKVPMAVCGDAESRHGIILAKNELAKKYNIKTAETVWQAKNKCPNLVLVPPRRGQYGKYCDIINTRVYECYTDLVERAGVDESYLDITGSLHLFGCTALELGNRIREHVKELTGLTISVGISFNKVFAKLGSDYKKPDAVTLITRENFKRIIWPLPAKSMLMVGETTEKTLRGLYINTIGDIAASPPGMLAGRLGKMGETLYVYARGEDTSPVVPEHSAEDVKSVGNGMTFKRNLLTPEDIHTGVLAMSDSVATRLRRGNKKCLSVTVAIKDTELKTITRQITLERPTRLSSEISKAAEKLVCENWKSGRPIRMLTITAGKLVAEDAAVEQLNFFESPADDMRRENLEKALEKVTRHYGENSVTRLSFYNSEFGIAKEHGVLKDKPDEK